MGFFAQVPKKQYAESNCMFNSIYWKNHII